MPITIKPRSQLCSLREVNVIKTMNPSCGFFLKVFEDLGIILNLGVNCIKPMIFLVVGKIFSTGPTDLGFTDLVEHEIKCVDGIPDR